MTKQADQTNQTVFVIEDEPSITAVVRRVCMILGVQAQVFSMASEFETCAPVSDDSTILLDLGLAEGNGIDVLRTLAERRCKAPIFLMSGEDKHLLNTVQRLGQSYGLNVAGILQKPFTIADLKAKLEASLSGEASIATRQRATMAEQLHRGIMGGELRVHYQPKVSASDGLVVGCEALVRWQHPARGLLGPGEFLPAAEESALMGQLTYWVLNEALRQCATWHAAGFDLHISVNMPPDMLQELALPTAVQSLLTKHDVPGSRLTLEVTEAAAMKGLTQALDVLTRLRLMKVSLSIDDFGTGHSSIVKLRQLPFNELKIDRSFVQDVAVDAEARTLVQTMASMGRNLGMTIVAEGVETAENLDVLPELGCALAQGYHLGRPMAADNFLEWLQQRPCRRMAAQG